MKPTWTALILLLTTLYASCNQVENAKPRPHMYPRIDFPQRGMTQMDVIQCPFQAEIPQYADVRFRTSEDGEPVPHPCWFDVHFSIFNATIHCSYYEINSDKTYSSLVEDAYTMVSKHNVMANFREEFELENKHGATGILFDIKGPVASPYQFYLTDKEKHFLRGSLYFDGKVERDSVQQIIDFLKVDLEALLSSVDFK